jgi:hypothetical protein
MLEGKLISIVWLGLALHIGSIAPPSTALRDASAG